MALGEPPSADAYAEIGVELVLMLFRHGQMERALALARDLLEQLPADARAMQLRLIAAAVSGAVLVPSLRHELQFFVSRIPDGLGGDTPEERLALSARLVVAFVANAPMDAIAASSPPLAGDLPAVFAVQLLRVGRARARIEADDVRAGVEELMDVGPTIGMGPAMCPWRSRAAPGLLALGRPNEAVALVEEELAAARASKSGWGQAVALEALALSDPDRAPAALDEALGLAERHGMALERARSLVLLGAFERRRGQRRRAESLLNDALESAAAIGALGVKERARSELVSIGLTLAAGAPTPAPR